MKTKWKMAVVSLLAIATIAFANGDDAWGDMGQMMGYGMFGMGAFGMLFMAVFWAAVILFFIWLVKTSGIFGPPAQAETPLEVLRKRYAKGEITKEQFQAMKKDLE